MKKLTHFLILVFLLAIAAPFAFADRPASSGNVASMSGIHMDINNIFFDKMHHFSVTVFDVSNVPLVNEPCAYYTEFKATGNVLETYELKQDCIAGLSECYYTTNSDGNLFGQLNISDTYYDIGREYTLRVSCGTVTSSIDFNVESWKVEETSFDFWVYISQAQVIGQVMQMVFGGLVIFCFAVCLIFIAKLVFRR